jgi:hypothetical protein
MATPAVADADPSLMEFLIFLEKHTCAVECIERGGLEGAEVTARAEIMGMLHAVVWEVLHRQLFTKKDPEMVQARKLTTEVHRHASKVSTDENAHEEAEKAHQEAEQTAAASMQAAVSFAANADVISQRGKHAQEVKPAVRERITNGIASTARRFMGRRPDEDQARGGAVFVRSPCV